MGCSSRTYICRKGNFVVKFHIIPQALLARPPGYEFECIDTKVMLHGRVRFDQNRSSFESLLCSAAYLIESATLLNDTSTQLPVIFPRKIRLLVRKIDGLRDLQEELNHIVSSISLDHACVVDDETFIYA